MKQGAFARYFDQKKLGMYLMKKLYFSAGEDMLLPLAGLCMDAAVNRFIIRERLGTKEIRERAFRELEKAEKEQVSDKAGTDLIHRIRLLYIRHVLENTNDEGTDPQAEIALYKILSLKDAENPHIPLLWWPHCKSSQPAENIPRTAFYIPAPAGEPSTALNESHRWRNGSSWTLPRD